MSYFQILGSDGTALEDLSESDCVPTYTTNLTNSCGPTFTLNEFKDSQFWYLDMVPGSDYGRIGPKKYSLRYSWAGTSTCLTVGMYVIERGLQIFLAFFNFGMIWVRGLTLLKVTKFS